MLVNIVKCKWKKNSYYSWRSLCDKKLETKLKWLKRIKKYFIM